MLYALLFAAVFFGAVIIWFGTFYIFDYFEDVVKYIVRRRQRYLRYKHHKQTQNIFDQQVKEKRK